MKGRRRATPHTGAAGALHKQGETSRSALPPAVAGAPGPVSRTAFGHPSGLVYLVSAEGFQFFAYSGAQALLTLYLTKWLFTPGHSASVIGFDAYRSAIEAVFGRTTLLGLASQTFGLFTGLMYGLPLAGALIADRWAGQRLTTCIGLASLVIGYALISFAPTFLIGLVVVILATGAYKSNLLGMIGRLYSPGDGRATRGYGAYLIAINVGSFASPLVCGTLAQSAGWRWAFVPLAIAAFLALVSVLAGMRRLPLDTVRTSERAATLSDASGRSNRPVVMVLLLLIALDILFVGTYNQTFDILPIWADAHVDRSMMGIAFPASAFSSLDGIFTMLGVALSMGLWSWQARRGREWGDITKLAVGAILGISAFALLAVAAALGGKASPIFPIFYLALIDLAITWFDLQVLSLVSRKSPSAIASTMMAIYLMSTMPANFMVGWLGTFYERMSAPTFWAMHGAILALTLPALFATRKYIRAALRANGAGPDNGTGDD